VWDACSVGRRVAQLWGFGVRATMGTAANQRCATMGTVPIVAAVHMDRIMRIESPRSSIVLLDILPLIENTLYKLS
jgi:hypothetical protein